jgi:hypothetical protein
MIINCKSYSPLYNHETNIKLIHVTLFSLILKYQYVLKRGLELGVEAEWAGGDKTPDLSNQISRLHKISVGC